MSELTNKQSKLIQRQIKKLYNRNYIAVKSGDNTLSIGDVLTDMKDTVPIIDSSAFPKKATKFIEGNKRNINITSDSEVNLTTKLKGSADFSEYFDLDEAGLIVEFQNNNDMLLKVRGIRQQSIKNFVEFRKELLSRYTQGELSSKVYIVRGLVYADKYYLQFSGSKGGKVGFNLKGSANVANMEADADFDIKWKKDVGFNVNAPKGGPLAYRVSAVRLNRHLIPTDLHDKIVAGNNESDLLDNLAFGTRKALLESNALEIVDATDELLLNEETTA
ncbi:MAG: hypothetical protein KDC84_14370 [Crocinitomicaceae bacterium]|nr:hypothetical protein [Crocinitomicaceae bacterium]